jgi:hypothetical protein
MKKVGYSVYVHKTALNTLPLGLQYLAYKAMDYLPEGFEYAVVRVNTKNQIVAFIESSDWDTANEPAVGTAYSVKPNGDVHKTNPSGKIYHHKWMFVNADYPGFDVKESIKRSELWKNTLPNDKYMLYRIGNRDYWQQLLRNYHLPL